MPRLEPRSLAILSATASATLIAATLLVALLQDLVGVPDASSVYLWRSSSPRSWAARSARCSRPSAPSFSTTSSSSSRRGPWSSMTPGPYRSTRCCSSQSASSSASWLLSSGPALPRPGPGNARLVPSSFSAASWPRANRRRPCWARSPPSCARRRVPSGSGSASDPTTPASGSRPTPAAATPRARSPSRASGARIDDEVPGRWIRVHRPGPGSRSDASVEAFRVHLQPAERAFGSIWCVRERRLGDPDPTETRLLAATADQVGLALAHDRLAAEVAGRRGGPPERRPEVGPAPVGVARPAHAAGDDPGRRWVARPGRRPQPRRAARVRRRHRSRGGVPEPPRHQPPGPQSDRGRGTHRGARRV